MFFMICSRYIVSDERSTRCDDQHLSVCVCVGCASCAGAWLLVRRPISRWRQRGALWSECWLLLVSYHTYCWTTSRVFESRIKRQPPESSPGSSM